MRVVLAALLIAAAGYLIGWAVGGGEVIIMLNPECPVKQIVALR